MKIKFNPSINEGNEELYDFLEKNIKINYDESEWDGENFDLKRRVLGVELPVQTKEEICNRFYGESIDNVQLDKEVGIMQLLSIRLNKESKEYYLLNAGYYAYGRDGWDIDEYFEFTPTPQSLQWSNEIVIELERIGWHIDVSF